VIFFGNGGSAQDAGHLAAELMGRFAFDRPGLAAISLPDATAAVTAIANDYSYADVFARQVLAAGQPGDVVVGLTTSGNSANVVRALEAAAQAGMTTVALTGESGGKAAAVAIRSARWWRRRCSPGHPDGAGARPPEDQHGLPGPRRNDQRPSGPRGVHHLTR
jgi:phosphoheptose isomerase